jgi:hypothetical protein
MSEANRVAWATAARTHPVKDRFGVSRYLSGYQLYLSMPRGLILFGNLWYYDKPPTYTYDDTFSASCILGAGFYGVITVASADHTSEWIANIWFCRWRPASGTSRCFRFVSAGQIGLGVGMTDISAYLESSGLYFVTGEKVRVKLQHWSAAYWPCDVDLGLVTVS